MRGVDIHREVQYVAMLKEQPACFAWVGQAVLTGVLVAFALLPPTYPSAGLDQ